MSTVTINGFNALSRFVVGSALVVGIWNGNKSVYVNRDEWDLYQLRMTKALKDHEAALAPPKAAAAGGVLEFAPGVPMPAELQEIAKSLA